MKNKPLKLLLNIFTIIIVLSFVLYFSLKDNYQEILTSIFNINKTSILTAILILFLYRFLISLIYYKIIKINKEKVSLLKCLQINTIIPFFHAVTPFAGGGQPMEVYYLHKEGISITKSTNITLQNFIVYQVALVIIGIFALTYNHIANIFPNNHLIKKLVVLGFLINLLVLLASFFLNFGKKIQTHLLTKIINILTKLKIIKDKEKIQKKITEYLTKFHQNTLQLRKNKLTFIYLIILSIISLFILYSIPYILSQGLNLNLSLIDTIVATTYVTIIGAFIPIPGGTGGIEYGFIFFYNYLIKGSITNALMLIWRFITYYLAMIIGAIILLLYRKKEKQCE